MADSDRAPLGADIYESIEIQQYAIHKAYWPRLQEMQEISASVRQRFFPRDSSPLPPKRPFQLGQVLAAYACELFDAEARCYPAHPQITLWFSNLTARVEELVMSRIVEMDKISVTATLAYHATKSEMQIMIREALKERVKALLQPPMCESNSLALTQPVSEHESQATSELITKDEEALAAESHNEAGKLDPVAEDRKALLAAYKAKGREMGIRITDAMVAKAANPGRWNERTMVTWWKRNDLKCKPPHDRKIRAVLGRDPASNWPTK
jgi:hypothetical protein